MKNGLSWRMALVVGILIGAAANAPRVNGNGGGSEFVPARHGPFGPPGPRMCEQLWMIPSGSPDVDLRATVFRPRDGALGCADSARPRPLAIINHGTDAGTRESVSMPVFYWLSRWFVDRGWVVVLPQRRGHGATGGELSEGLDTCSRPDHFAAGQAAADDIEAAARFMAKQSFVDSDRLVVVGVSSGGWASLALAGRSLPSLKAVVNFAGGRGAYAWGRPRAVCGLDHLVAAAARYGASSHVPTLWLYSENDSYFEPDVATAMANAYSSSGGRAELHLLAPYGREGHYLADDRDGWGLWGRQLSSFLDRNVPHPRARSIQAGVGAHFSNSH